VTHYY